MNCTIKVRFAGHSWIAECEGRITGLGDPHSIFEPEDAAIMAAVRRAGLPSVTPEQAGGLARSIGITIRHINSHRDEEIFEACIPEVENKT